MLYRVRGVLRSYCTHHTTCQCTHHTTCQCTHHTTCQCTVHTIQQFVRRTDAPYQRAGCVRGRMSVQLAVPRQPRNGSHLELGQSFLQLPVMVGVRVQWASRSLRCLFLLHDCIILILKCGILSSNVHGRQRRISWQRLHIEKVLQGHRFIILPSFVRSRNTLGKHTGAIVATTSAMCISGSASGASSLRRREDKTGWRRKWITGMVGHNLHITGPLRWDFAPESCQLQNARCRRTMLLLRACARKRVGWKSNTLYVAGITGGDMRQP